MNATDEARAKSLADLAYWRDRQEWSDQHILSDMCNTFRAQAKGQADMIAGSMAGEERVEAEIRRTGSEEG